jgi:hypothetical protein
MLTDDQVSAVVNAVEAMLAQYHEQAHLRAETPALCSTCNGTRTVHFGGRFVLCQDCDPPFTTAIAAVADALPVEPQIGADAREKVRPMRAGEPAPVPMLLFCPRCGTQHIDAPEPDTGWTNPPHRSHKCNCGCIWRPADVPTDGVVSIRTRGSADTWSATWTDGVTRARPAPAPDAGALEAAQRIVDAGEPSPYDPYDHELYEQAKRRIVELEAIRRDLNRSLEVDNATAAKLAEELDKARGAFEAMRLMYQDATASAKRAEAALETVRAECEAMRAVCKQWKPVVDAALVARETSNNLMDLWEAVQALRAAQGTE